MPAQPIPQKGDALKALVPAIFIVLVACKTVSEKMPSEPSPRAQPEASASEPYPYAGPGSDDVGVGGDTASVEPPPETNEAAQPAAASAVEPAGSFVGVRHLFSIYCGSCHSPDSGYGNYVDQESIDANRGAVAAAIRSGAMPPGGMPTIEQQLLLEYLEQ